MNNLRQRIERAYCEANRQSEPLDCPAECYIYAPVGDYECSVSLSSSDSGEASVINDSGCVPNAPTSPEFFNNNTATARLVLAMPVIMGFLVAAIVVAGYVWRF